jgi:oxygen-dependent protoporphyrinogen oxidase
LAAPVALNAAVREVRPDGEGGFVVRHGSDDELLVDAVVLAVPARAASALLGDLAPAAATALQRIRTSSVATVVAALPRSLLSTHPALAGTGIPVPPTSGWLLRAATFLTSKWPQLADTDQLLVRLSAGRSGHDAIDTLPDDELVDALVGDLADVLEVAVAPSATLVRRWPHSMPQQEVGHRELVEGVRRALGGAASRIALAGASYDGVGVAACLRSGELAAERLLAGAAAHVDAGVRA